MDKKTEPERETIIPDYDYLFNESPDRRGKPKSHFLRKILRLNLRSVIFSCFLFLIQITPEWVVPLLTANIINLAVRAVEAGAISHEIMRLLVINGSVMAVVISLNVPMTVWQWRVTSKMLRGTSAGIKRTVVRKLQSLSLTYSKNMKTGKVQAKFLKDIDSVDSLLSTVIRTIIPTVLSAIFSTTISVYKNPYVALFFLVVIPANVILSRAFRKKIGAGYRDYRLKTENMSARLSTMLEMIPVTKSHGLEQSEIDRMQRSIRHLEGSGLQVDRTNAWFGSWVYVVNQLLKASCLIFCTFLAIKGKIEIGDIVLYQSMFSQISGQVSTLINVAPQIGSGLDALNSLSDLMNETDVEISLGKANVPDIIGNVKFENVSYCYPDNEHMVVADFSIDVKAGECIAVVGSSGSGKSTLMNMIIGFLKPSKGNIFIDGKDITEYNLSEYRHHISVVPQSSILFDGTIRENITYGLNEYSEDELQAVVEKANLNEFLKELPNGIDTVIGEHGDKLSGGQKQRITIARALIRNPKILILDEATSALDNISEYMVQKAIASSIRGRTTFIVAHRLSTIRDADRIVVMEEGRCVECGTFEELMALHGKFYELKSLNDLNLKEAEEHLA